MGGDFYYEPQPGDTPHDLLFIAGGVGINPILSMVRHVAYLLQKIHKGQKVFQTGKVMILFSAGCKEELVFKVRFSAYHL